MSRNHSYRHSDPGPRGKPRCHRSAVVPMRPLQLPRELARPGSDDSTSRDAIISADPSLADVPIPFIRHTLRDKHQQMLDGRNCLASSHVPQCLPFNLLPNSLHVPLLSTSRLYTASFPTHALAVYSSKGISTQATILLIHSTVFVVHCSLRLPPAHSPKRTSISLPIIKLPIPSVPAFIVLYEYMYSQRLDHVLRSLLPLPSDFLEALSHDDIMEARLSSSTVQKLGTFLVIQENGNFQQLMTYASRIKDLWQNMITLCVYIPELWDTLDLAWDIALCALNVASARHG